MGSTVITGGAGFIGSRLARRLVDLGRRVVVLDNFSTGRRSNLADLASHPLVTVVESDLRDTALLDDVIAEADEVYHLAAAVGVRLIVEDPVHTIETNVQGASEVLRVAAKWMRPILLTSTSEVYGKGTRTPFSEDDDTIYGPTKNSRWSYAFSKAIDEFLALAYHQSRGLPVVIVRLFNTVGPGQVGDYGMVAPRLVQQALAGGPIQVYGDGAQSRCFCHVDDIVPALIKLLATPAAHGLVVNLGSDEEVSINELAERIRAKVNPACAIKHVPYDEAYRPGFEDLRRRVPALDRARRLIGFAPSRNLDKILDDVIAYCRASGASQAE